MLLLLLLHPLANRPFHVPCVCVCDCVLSCACVPCVPACVPCVPCVPVCVRACVRQVSKGPYLGKELEFGMKGRLAKDVPNTIAHTPGLATSPRFRNSPRMTFSHEPRF